MDSPKITLINKNKIIYTANLNKNFLNYEYFDLIYFLKLNCKIFKTKQVFFSR